MKERKPLDSPGTTTAMDSPPTAAKKPRMQAALGREIQAKIGQQLRAYYDTLIEPTPQRFAELLQRLDQASGKDKSE